MRLGGGPLLIIQPGKSRFCLYKILDRRLHHSCFSFTPSSLAKVGNLWQWLELLPSQVAKHSILEKPYNNSIGSLGTYVEMGCWAQWPTILRQFMPLLPLVWRFTGWCREPSDCHWWGFLSPILEKESQPQKASGLGALWCSKKRWIKRASHKMFHLLPDGCCTTAQHLFWSGPCIQTPGEATRLESFQLSWQTCHETCSLYCWTATLPWWEIRNPSLPTPVLVGKILYFPFQLWELLIKSKMKYTWPHFLSFREARRLL